MDQTRIRQILSSASAEITRLRRQNEILTAQVAVVEVFAATAGLRKNEGVAMCVDINWEIEKAIEELNREEADMPPANKAPSES